MNPHAPFAYAQARLQARHGARADETTWQQLEGISDVAHYLQTARRTPLRPWVLTLTPHTKVHELEHILYQQFCAYVDEVARWQPSLWRPAVTWVKALVLLPALQHLLAGEAAPAWMRADPALKPFTCEDRNTRMAALLDSAYAPLLQGWQSGASLRSAWLRRWRALWPDTSVPLRQPLNGIVRSFEAQLAQLSAAKDAVAARAALGAAMLKQFRHHRQQPAAAFANLALVALDVERLRGQLLRRMLFEEGLP